MKKQSILFFLIVVAAVAMVSFGQGTPGQKAAPGGEVDEMRNQINELQARIQILENRVNGLQSTVEQTAQPHLQPLASPGGNLPVPQAPAAGPMRPKIWGQRQINGWTFYVVPCAQR